MASLPEIPFTDIEDFRVAVDAPVSTDLMTDIVVDLNNLRSILTDGAAAVEDINANNVTVNGTLNTGVFFSSEQLYILFVGV